MRFYMSGQAFLKGDNSVLSLSGRSREAAWGTAAAQKDFSTHMLTLTDLLLAVSKKEVESCKHVLIFPPDSFF